MFDFADITLIDILPFIAIGFAAQIVDGALGMAFGVITQTLLVGVLGLPPAAASASASGESYSSIYSQCTPSMRRNHDSWRLA